MPVPGHLVWANPQVKGGGHMGKTMIDASNYFEASAGEFRKLPRRITQLFLGSIGDSVKWAGSTWSFNFRSKSSFYWTDGEWLVRVSDHWSEGFVRCACGNIRKCRWTLCGRSRSMKEGCEDGFYAGVCRFSDMRWRS